MKNQFVEKNELCRLIPHDGSMCLLDKVAEWDEKRIVCYSETHQSMDNPLRNDQGLPATALIEYGAQAMAVHGGLLSSHRDDSINQGYLASLRNIVIEATGDVSTINTPICIEAVQIMASQGNFIYNFSIKMDQCMLVSGRATVVAIIND